MGKLSTATYKETLKQYAFGIEQDVKSSLADFIAPRVPVGTGTGTYKKFDSQDAFQIYDTRRAVGGRANRIHFDADDPTFNCEANALEIPIDDQERAKAGDKQQALEEARSRTLVISGCLAREKKVVDTAFATISAADTWDHTGNTDIVSAIDAQLVAMSKATGRMPNRMVIGLNPWTWVKNHKSVLDRHSPTNGKGVSLDGFAAMLAAPGIDIRVSVLAYDKSMKPKTPNKNFIFGNDILLFYANPNPTEFDPSFMKTFSIGNQSVEDVYTYRDDSCRSDILAVDWSEDVEVISTLCAKRISLV